MVSVDVARQKLQRIQNFHDSEAELCLCAHLETDEGWQFHRSVDVCDVDDRMRSEPSKERLTGVK